MSHPPNLVEAEEAEEAVSIVVHPASSVDSSIPEKIKRWYSHRSFKAITFSVLASLSVTMAFVGLFTGRVEGCEALGFIISVITLFSPSPLTI